MEDKVTEIKEEKRTVYAKEEMFYVRRIIWFILDIAEILLVLRFLFKLLGANAASQFVRVLYSLTDPLVVAFQGIFPATPIEIGVVEWATLVAMIIYALLASFLLRLLRLLQR